MPRARAGDEGGRPDPGHARPALGLPSRGAGAEADGHVGHRAQARCTHEAGPQTLMTQVAAPAGARRRGAVQLARFGADPLAYLDAARALEGDILSSGLGTQSGHLVRKPELIRAALVNEDWPPISRGRLMGLDKWYSGGLILTEGEEHHRQRDNLWKPLLSDPAAARIAVERTERWVASWDGQPIELFGAFRDLCWSIDWQALTGEDITPELLKAQATGIP